MAGSFIKKIAYSVLNLLNGNKGIRRTINRFTIRFPAEWSRFYEHNYEKENYEFLRRIVKPGMHIVDVGAHLGLFSVACSQLAGPSAKIVSFEPTPGTYSVLTKTLELNHCDNVTPVQGAISDKEGEAVFYVSTIGGCNSNSLVKNKIESKLNEHTVTLFTIDQVVEKYSLTPGLLKIDAEGAELDVLKGGRNTLQKFKPILILGLHPTFINQKGDTLEGIWDRLSEAGYEIRENEKTLIKSDFCGRQLLFDVHCIPQ